MEILKVALTLQGYVVLQDKGKRQKYAPKNSRGESRASVRLSKLSNDMHLGVHVPELKALTSMISVARAVTIAATSLPFVLLRGEFLIHLPLPLPLIF